MYNLSKAEWRDLLPGVRVEWGPVSSPTLRKARRAAAAAFVEHGAEAFDEAADAFTAELIRGCIRNWTGIGDADGAEAPVTPETIEAFIADARLFDAADATFVAPWAQADAEKNGSSPSQNGTSGAKTLAKPTAPTARRRATPAPTKPKPRTAKPVKPSGRS